MTKIVQERIIQDEDGNIKRKEQIKQFRSEEPNYIKIYLEDITFLYNIPKSASDLLYELFNYVTYNTHQIIINQAVKRQINTKTNINIQVISNNITKLVKKGILKREDTGMYTLNPFLFGKGDWKSIKELRNQNIEMKIIYNKETNKREIYTELEKNPSLPFENFENQEDKEKVS